MICQEKMLAGMYMPKYQIIRISLGQLTQEISKKRLIHYTINIYYTHSNHSITLHYYIQQLDQQFTPVKGLPRFSSKAQTLFLINDKNNVQCNRKIQTPIVYNSNGATTSYKIVEKKVDQLFIKKCSIMISSNLNIINLIIFTKEQNIIWISQIEQQMAWDTITNGLVVLKIIKSNIKYATIKGYNLINLQLIIILSKKIMWYSKHLLKSSNHQNGCIIVRKLSARDYY